MLQSKADLSSQSTSNLIDVGSEQDLKKEEMLLSKVGKFGIVVFYFEGKAYATDNRCPHMGYPLSKGTVKDGILTCHWHHARFDLESGGTFDLFADDVQVYETKIDKGRILVQFPAQGSSSGTVTESKKIAHVDRKLREGLEHSLNLVIAKSVIQEFALATTPEEAVKRILKIASEFGATNRLQGWGPGLTILTSMANILQDIGNNDKDDDRVSALVQGLVHVSSDCFQEPVRHALVPLSSDTTFFEEAGEQKEYLAVKKWFMTFVDQREPEAAERTLQSAIQLFTKEQVAEMVLASATDHIFLNGGHVFDFANKAFELIQKIGWSSGASVILPSLVRQICLAERHEEDAQWRNPDDLISLVREAEARIPKLLDTSPNKSVAGPSEEEKIENLASLYLSDKPHEIIKGIEEIISKGTMSLGEIALSLASAAAIRIARFHTQNEFGDWITVLHSFSYCNAVLQSMSVVKDRETIIRAIYHGAMNLYLTRFLNIPKAPLPESEKKEEAGETTKKDEASILSEILVAMDHKDVELAARLISRYFESDNLPPSKLISTLIHSVVREDADFHTFQLIEASIRTLDSIKERTHGRRSELERMVLVGAARYIAAHSPTDRSLPQTIKIAQRLQRGEALYE